MEEMQKFLLFLCRLEADLTGREMKYLMWRFVENKTTREIIKIDGLKVSHQTVNAVMQTAYKKIGFNSKNKYVILEQGWPTKDNGKE